MHPRVRRAPGRAQVEDWQPRPFDEYSIYELHVGSFTPGGFPGRSNHWFIGSSLVHHWFIIGSSLVHWFIIGSSLVHQRPVGLTAWWVFNDAQQALMFIKVQAQVPQFLIPYLFRIGTSSVQTGGVV